MNILMISAEVMPYTRGGGLGEVMAGLPKAIHRLGHDVRVYAPLHGSIDRNQFAFVPIGRPQILRTGKITANVSFRAGILAQEIPIYFLDAPDFFGKQKKLYDVYGGNLPYAIFDFSVWKLLETLDWIPDVIHCHDWHAGLIPNIIKTLPKTSPYKKIATVFTVHNGAFVSMVSQWDIPIERQDSGRGAVPRSASAIHDTNFMKRGVMNADIITTVSERHAGELLTEERGHGLETALTQVKDRFFGVRNGVDYSVFNPHFDQHLPVNYDYDLLHRKYDNKRHLQHQLGLTVDERIPLLGMNTRITEQKGFPLLFDIFEDLMKLGVQIVVCGTGQGAYAKFLTKMTKQYPTQAAFQTYSPALGSLVWAASDIFLMPSLFEPAGLGQLVSLRYGSVPVVRRTGGLADTITDVEESHEGNGFVFDDYTGTALLAAIKRALKFYREPKAWETLMRHGMQQSYSWEVPAKKYVQLYRAAIKQHQGKSWQLPPKW